MAVRHGIPRSVLGMRSVAGQVFLLQAVIVVLLVAAAMAALVLESRDASEREARNRSVAVAETLANAPGIQEALADDDPTARLQPQAARARKGSGVDFVVVMAPDGTRYTHPVQDRVGERFVGDLERARSGEVHTEKITGTLGPLVQAVVPVFDDRGRVVGMVSAGITIDRVSGVVEEQLPLLFGSAVAVLLLATGGTALVTKRLRRQTHGLGPAEMTRMYEHHDAVLHSVREGVLILSAEGRLLLANDEARRLLDMPSDVDNVPVDELGLDPDITELLRSGRVASDEVLPVAGRMLAVNQRQTDTGSGPAGTVTTLRDSTELRALTGRVDIARERLELLFDASTEIGTTLDVGRTCEELAEFAAGRFADLATVDLIEAVLRGEEPAGAAYDPQMRRTAVRGAMGDGARQDDDAGGHAGGYEAGALIRFLPSTPMGACIAGGKAVLEGDLASLGSWHDQAPERAKELVARGAHSLIAVPLRARGAILGVAMLWRGGDSPAFEEDDLFLAEELAARATVAIDNARRYSREHTMAVTLQRSLLPRGLPEQNALDLAYRYRPAQASLGGLGGVGGDWFDIIPLPGARVALVVGDVVGHGVHAAATMGRLRTAVHNFSSLDLPPDELLWHLDELVTRIDSTESADGAGGPDGSLGPGGPAPAVSMDAAITGATCIYAIYDPITRVCTMARAGHHQPAVLAPDGTAVFAEVPGGPPLGLGGMPFETLEMELPVGSTLVLYTDGLVEDRHRDIDVGLTELRETLAGHPERPPEETCEVLLDALLPERPRDDVALLVGRTRALDADRVAEWTVPPDPSEVARVRAEAVRTLSSWGLEEDSFVTELILSELVTNSIRYASGPVGVRLIRDRHLICEVSDNSTTSPHLRQAAMTDEGGRGLFLVAQLAERWGTRYTGGGKVIWTEQPLAPDAGRPSGNS